MVTQGIPNWADQIDLTDKDRKILAEAIALKDSWWKSQELATNVRLLANKLMTWGKMPSDTTYLMQWLQLAKDIEPERIRSQWKTQNLQFESPLYLDWYWESIQINSIDIIEIRNTIDWTAKSKFYIVRFNFQLSETESDNRLPRNIGKSLYELIIPEKLSQKHKKYLENKIKTFTRRNSFVLWKYNNIEFSSSFPVWWDESEILLETLIDTDKIKKLFEDYVIGWDITRYWHKVWVVHNWDSKSKR